MDLALWLYEDAAEEEDKAAKGESSGSYQLEIEAHSCWIFEIRCKYAHIFEVFANFFPKSFPLYAQAYFKKASIFVSETGCPKHSKRIRTCLIGMFLPAR